MSCTLRPMARLLLGTRGFSGSEEFADRNMKFRTTEPSGAQTEPIEYEFFSGSVWQFKSRPSCSPRNERPSRIPD